MNSFPGSAGSKSIFFLIALNLIIGLFIFRDYGLSWDEPLFYNYGDALGYAYSPKEWFSGHFDLTQSYGSSGDDHKTRGPAYLLLAREPVALLQSFGLDSAAAWHLINFIFFQGAVYCLYRLSRRWLTSAAALSASALFAWQPLLWGHAFINPKDPPFLTFFLAAVTIGFEMVDNLLEPPSQISVSKGRFFIVAAAFFLGIATSIRVLGPLAGLLVGCYLFVRTMSLPSATRPRAAWNAFFAYGLLSVLIMLVTWPFLWGNPIARFGDVFRLMSDNPTNLSVLFGGQVYRAGELPRRYLPFMLFTTLTEPIWPLAGLGVLYVVWKLRSTIKLAINPYWLTLALTVSWFVILLLYALLRRPAMYDGLRHFMFILPPIFILSGFGIESLFQWIGIRWLRAIALLVMLLPGFYAAIMLHPFEYTYYNSFVGGTAGAFRKYETDYWLTCYKEAVEQLNQNLNEPTNLFVHREAYIAAYYAKPSLHVQDVRGALQTIQSGDALLVNTRTNEDRRTFKDTPSLLEVGRGRATFCIVKGIP